MTSHPIDTIDTLRFTPRQHALYVAVAFTIWLTGVAIVRLLPAAAFDTNEVWPTAMFASSLVLGAVTQLAMPIVLRLPLAHTLVPVMVICGAALVMDGVAIAFTDIYSSDTETKAVVGGWLLWTFGTQIVISIIMIARGSRPHPGEHSR